MRLMIAGDTHGNSKVVRRKAAEAKELGAATMFIVGDFGMWPGVEGVNYLDEVNDAAREFDIRIIALPGNHEDHPQWSKWLDLGPKDKKGFTYVRSNLLISPKVHFFKMDGKRFAILGGAVSIDKQWRTEGKSWWRDEEFSEKELSIIKRYTGPKVDFLLSHDCSDLTPFRARLKPDVDSQMNRRRLDEAIEIIKPSYHFHGHMHTKYDWVNVGNSRSLNVQTYGLDCDGEFNSFVILDTGADRTLDSQNKVEVYWPAKARMVLSPDQ